MALNQLVVLSDLTSTNTRAGRGTVMAELDSTDVDQIREFYRRHGERAVHLVRHDSRTLSIGERAHCFGGAAWAP